MKTLKQLKAGAVIGDPIYNSKPYVVLSKENVVLAAGTLEELTALNAYFDDCAVGVRQHDLHLNDNTHTPGPWANEPARTTPGRPVIAREITSGIRHIADVRLYEDADSANARLIAAAPDLLAALEALLPILDNDHSVCRAYDDVGEKARAAISKATGQ